MAKKPALKSASTSAQPPKRRTNVLDELEQIFARPSASASSVASRAAAAITAANKKNKAASSSNATTSSTVPQKSKKRKASETVDDQTVVEPKARKVETIFDSSAELSKAVQQPAPSVSKATGANDKDDDEEERFRDSRGTRRKTDDGLPIYSTNELKIGLGGDTEACPFDCDCCF